MKWFLLLLFSFVLAAPILTVETSSENSNLSFEPELNNESTLIGSSNQTQIEVAPLGTVWDNAIPVKLLLAPDEEELTKSYWTPYGYMNWRLYVYIILEKVSYRLVERVGVYPVGWDSVTWHSDASFYEDRFYEMVNELGWSSNGVYNVLFGVTGVPLTPAYGCVDSNISAIIVHWKVWWADDQLIEHEFGHIFGLHDHYESSPHYHDDCIMSNEPVWQDLWFEDGYIWGVFSWEPRVFLTRNYCALCEQTLNANKDRYVIWWYVNNGGKKYPILPVNKEVEE